MKASNENAAGASKRLMHGRITYYGHNVRIFGSLDFHSGHIPSLEPIALGGFDPFLSAFLKPKSLISGTFRSFFPFELWIKREHV